MQDKLKQKQTFENQFKLSSQNKTKEAPLNLQAFNTGMFDISPPEGLYKIDIGMGDENFGHLLTFGDLNADKFSDMVTLVDSRSALQIHVYDSIEMKFKKWKKISVDGCS